MANNTVVVLGCRRSGTSMIAGILHYLGVDMGMDDSQRSEFNPQGYFEDRDIISISEEMLSKLGNDGTQWGELEREFGPRIQEVVNSKAKEMWGFKDVNQLPLHRLYQKYLPNPRYVSIFRNVLSVTHSFRRWHRNTTFPSVLTEMQNYYTMLVMLTTQLAQTYPVITFAYERVLEKPEESVLQLAKFLVVEPSKKQITAAIKHINPGIKNF